MSLILEQKTEYGRYVPQGSTDPTEYPQSIYGTEVFEVNDNLRQLAIGFAKTAVLNDSSDAMAYRANYASTSAYEAGSRGPSVVGCDGATSDVYFSGTLLSEAFENTTKLFTNGSGVYCTTAQEDTATLEALLRGAIANLTDFSRIIIMRTASDFDRPYAGEVRTFRSLPSIPDDIPGYKTCLGEQKALNLPPRCLFLGLLARRSNADSQSP